MKIVFVAKYPPIQGGVSAYVYWTCRSLAEAGHEIHVVTNAAEVEPAFRIFLDEDDAGMCQPSFSSTGGGYVTVHRTNEQFSQNTYIPWANPFVTRLAGLTAVVIKRHGCDLIYAQYLEPYAVAAALVSSWFKIPYALRHAGSDIGRLANDPDLRVSYSEVFRNASVVLTPSSWYVPILRSLGAREESLIFDGIYSVPTEYFNPKAEPLDIGKIVEETHSWCEELHYPDPIKRAIVRVNKTDFDSTIPVVGVYGKIGKTKGSFDLLHALALIRTGKPFYLLAMSNGVESLFRSWLDLVGALGLEKHIRILPFLPHWRVPSFIKSCRFVCFLERGFPITFHNPVVPREVLACGACLVCSGESAKKLFFARNIVAGKNMIVVDDPRDHPSLAATLSWLIEDKESVKTVGYYGYNLSSMIEDFAFFKKSRHELFLKIVGTKVGSSIL